MTLSARISAASVEQTREMLEEAWEYLCQADKQFRRWACNIIDERGTTNAGRFGNAVEFGFYHDAAMMLIPEGWRAYSADLSVRGKSRWMIEGPKTKYKLDDEGFKVAGDDWYAQGIAVSIPLAIAAAAVKVKECE